jgi:hypothetical protein
MSVEHTHQSEASYRPPTPHELVDPHLALCYAYYTIKGRWPEGEAVIAQDSWSSCRYAYSILRERFPAGEEAIAKSTRREDYLRRFPSAKDDWVVAGWIDWLDT